MVCVRYMQHIGQGEQWAAGEGEGQCRGNVTNILRHATFINDIFPLLISFRQMII